LSGQRFSLGASFFHLASLFFLILYILSILFILSYSSDADRRNSHLVRRDVTCNCHAEEKRGQDQQDFQDEQDGLGL